MISWIGRLFSSIWSKVKPAVKSLATEAGELALDLAVKYVKELSYADLSSSDKRDAAFTMIKAELEEDGKEIGDSLINYAIETAVQTIKNS
jgi:hypothetical protein